ncbi:MAG: hypothetical protein ABIE43_01385 [Patescibacteria group bacterium]
MIKRILVIILFILIIGNVWFYIGINYAVADSFSDGLKNTAGGTGHLTLNSDLPIIIGLVIRVILSFLGVIFLVLMIYGGYIWMTARGNDQGIEKAKTIIRNSLIGLAIILAAYAITWLMYNFYIVKEYAG